MIVAAVAMAGWCANLNTLVAVLLDFRKLAVDDRGVDLVQLVLW